MLVHDDTYWAEKNKAMDVIPKKKDFLDLSQEQCLAVYAKILDNSDRHFKVAEQLQKIDEFGMAISHLVLGSEELVKGMVIFLDGYGFAVRQAVGVKYLFYKHKPRHLFSTMYSFMVQLINPFYDFMFRFIDIYQNPDKRVDISPFEESLL